MCGRFVTASRPEDIASYFDATLGDRPDEEPLPPRFNVAPTDHVHVVRAAPQGRVLELVRWGLVPSWAGDAKSGASRINARAETVATNGTFQASFRSRRCLVPADGFYEWRPIPGTKRKQPVFISRRDGLPLAFAGLWAAWRPRPPEGAPDAPADPWLLSATIVTTEANATIAPIHDRMPVILPPEAWATWLDPNEHDRGVLEALLVPADDDLLDVRPVSNAVNDVRHDGPELVEPVDELTAADLDAAPPQRNRQSPRHPRPEPVQESLW
jgi:putative SOS response-associated peptidase YedK